MNRRHAIGSIIAIICVVLVSLVFVRPMSRSQSSSKMQVTTSFYPLYFFAQRIGGEMARVVNITPAGGEPHDYEPTADDIVRIENSALLIVNGGGLEAWGDKIKQNIDPQKTLLVTAGEGLTTQQVVEEENTITDPHAWLSPPLAVRMVEKIEIGFAKADPKNASYYEANASAFKSELAALDADYKSGLADCGEKNIVTSHAAFGYLATAYDLNQVPIAGLSPDAEPSPKQLGGIAKFAKENKVKYIFFESLVSPKLSETVAREIGAQTLVLNPIEGLTSEEITARKSYLTEMRSNLANLRIALGCKN